MKKEERDDGISISRRSKEIEEVVEEVVEEGEERGKGRALFAASVRNLLALGSVSNWDTVYGCVTRHPSLPLFPSLSP